jgi:hypothetical protein
LHAVIELAGQADTAPLGQGHSHLLFVKMIVFLIFRMMIDAGNVSLAHLLQELGDKNPLHLRADLGQVLAPDLGVLGFSLTLQGIERSQARAAQGAGRQSGHDIVAHSRLLR